MSRSRNQASDFSTHHGGSHPDSLAAWADIASSTWRMDLKDLHDLKGLDPKLLKDFNLKDLDDLKDLDKNTLEKLRKLLMWRRRWDSEYLDLWDWLPYLWLDDDDDPKHPQRSAEAPHGGGGGGSAPAASDSATYYDNGFNGEDWSPGTSGYAGEWAGGESAPPVPFDQSIIYNGPPLAFGNPQDFFFTQFGHPQWNPSGLDRSSDCGPTSLAMIALAMGKFDPAMNRDSMIVAARSAMGASSDRSTGTGDDQVVQGANNLGLNARSVRGGSVNDIRQCLQTGGMCVVSGNPISYERELGFNNGTNDLYADSGTYNGLHFIAITGFNQQTGNFITNDPACKIGPFELTAQQLTTYMAGDPNHAVVQIHP